MRLPSFGSDLAPPDQRNRETREGNQRRQPQPRSHKPQPVHRHDDPADGYRRRRPPPCGNSTPTHLIVTTRRRSTEDAHQDARAIGKGGLYGNVIRIAPPLNIAKADADEAVRILDEAMSQRVTKAPSH